MRAAQQRLDIASHNIANAATRGFQRQRLEQVASGFDAVPAIFSRSGVAPGGVTVKGVTRSFDQLALDRRAHNGADAAQARSTADHLERLESAFPEPGELGLSNQFAEFWSSWQEVTNQPSSSAARSALLAQAGSLITAVRRTHTDLQTLRSDAIIELGALSGQANELAGRIAAISNVINGADPMASATADLRSQRDDLAQQLAELTGSRVNILEDGTYQVLVSGRPIVDGVNVAETSVTAAQIVWADSNAPIAVGGRIAGVQAMISGTYPAYEASLDAVANQLVTDLNALHSTGFDQSGTTGRIFFDPAGTTAATLALDTSANGVSGHPERIAAGAIAAPEDGDKARQIAALANSSTGADALYQSLVSQLGVDVRLARGRAEAQTVLADASAREVENLSGVNIDEETVDLAAAQRAFQAAARVITTMDDMLDTLINRTGTVGR
jgi:flagellar hook-associated protein 1 FlgK